MIKNLPNVSFKDPMIWIATWFGCGLMRPGPGTWGTIGALPFGILFYVIGGIPLLFLGILVVCWLGYLAAKRFEEQAGDHDNGAIVVDEVAGMWIALLPTGMNPLYILLAFALFRFFDILKPWPISWADKKIPGAAGVMIDDIIAGFVAALIIGGLRYAGIG